MQNKQHKIDFIKPRLYFTCPIKALYMMKEFGIIFIVGDQGHYDYKQCLPYTLEHLTNHHTRGKFYVSGGSEVIFLPKKDDWGKIKDMPSRFVKFNGINEWKEIHGGGYRTGIDASEIIMRDNKHFFDCEREND